MILSVSWPAGTEQINWLALFKISDSFSRDCPLGCVTTSHHLCREQWPMDNLLHMQLRYYEVITAPLSHITAVLRLKDFHFLRLLKLLKCAREFSLTSHSSPKSILTNEGSGAWGRPHPRLLNANGGTQCRTHPLRVRYNLNRVLDS